MQQTQQAITFDEHGFLTNPGMWDEHLARQLAQQSGIEELTPFHWQMVERIRSYFLQYGVPPLFHHICFEQGLDHHCIDKLFKSQRNACRIAGITDPGEEANAYMTSSEQRDQ